MELIKLGPLSILHKIRVNLTKLKTTKYKKKKKELDRCEVPGVKVEERKGLTAGWLRN